MQYNVHSTKCYAQFCPGNHLAASFVVLEFWLSKVVIWALTVLFFQFVNSCWLFALLLLLVVVESSLSLFIFWVSKSWFTMGAYTSNISSEPSSELELSPKISSICIVIWLMLQKILPSQTIVQPKYTNISNGSWNLPIVVLYKSQSTSVIRLVPYTLGPHNV